MAGLLDIIAGGFSPNGYVQQNFPSGMPGAIDGGDDPLGKLRKLLMIGELDGGNEQSPALPFAPTPSAAAGLPDAITGAAAPQGQPPEVPMPRPRPDGASQPTMDETTIGALQKAVPLGLLPQYYPEERNKPSDGLLSAIIPDARMRGRLSAALGAGLSSVDGRFGAGAFAKGMGGAMKGAGSFDKEQDEFDLKRKTAGEESKSREIRNEYLKALTAKAGNAASAAGSPGRRQTMWDDPRYRFDRARTAIASAHKDIDNQYVNDPRARRFSSPEEKKALADEIAKKKDEVSRNLQRRYQVTEDGEAPSAPAAKSAPPEISFKGNGTQATPYEPQSNADYDEIPSGAYYVHPSRGLLIKG
ncbi:MAG TPA: hypothetical protein VNZ94_00615 [Xanthobacteraceae bacterium]|nr:hypothetical protein [Xanthobacteraceae bacterium]